MKTTLLISTYNKIDALELCLLSVLRQKKMPDEILIADDGSRSDTKDFIDAFRSKFSVPLKHIWHEDNGFRKTIILNRALKVAQGDYIIQIDGDIILHKEFIKDHIDFAQKGGFVRGKRVWLSQGETDRLLQQKTIEVNIFTPKTRMLENAFRVKFLMHFFGRKNKPTGDGVMGGNTAFWREDAIKINGFNNEIISWGIEDWEFAQRLAHLGNVRRTLRFGAVQYHLEHNEYERKPPQEHLEIAQKLKSEKFIECTNGLAQIDNFTEKFAIYE
ncbi:glycosyltransferase family 2 protein [Capnocytophaga catalasegens]|uniref:Glycosyl transferase n=1 Tax=Capnocytophaga catalasegens TaxID=1004260 RepID=A0AAV5AYK1_9FLAO|nr:glycosyltransferase family 2 protein [Capnocytophaga catalasegens]GIZ14551.1 glycosyl transferase [Capnocytophaga catalasegens]GJM50753.1 glycosyl transferase [Capnocytophaga catalasegens]GJM51906.1 glycosyl transferase [Capnocytophaga catalasegens]